jgi:PhnB protein
MNSTQSKRRANGFHTVTPYLTCAGAADAIEFYKKAFGAEEMIRVPGSDGKIMHACIMIGDSPVMLGDEFPGQGVLGPKSTGGTPVTIHLFVDDADAFAARAAEAGAKITLPVAEQFWGDRYGQLEDPFGHRWSVATPVKEMTAEEIREAASKMGGACG